MKAGWEIKKLGEVCKLYQPKTISVEMLVEDGEYLVYGANGIIGHYNQYNHEDSEVLLTCRGATCGSINISEPYSWINGNAMVVKPLDKNNIKQQFLKYYLISVDWNDIITGAAQPQITRLSLSPLPIPIPPLSEQEQIVSELDLISGIIEKKKQQLKELDSLAQSLFYEMFGNPVENDRGWEVKKLGEVCKLYQPKTISVEMLVEDGEYLVYGANGIIGHYNQYNHEDSEVLLTCRGATCGSINISEPYSWINGNAMVVKPLDKNNIKQQFLKYYLISVDWNDIITGAAQPQITRLSLSPLPIPIPPLSLQQEFASRIEKIERQKELIKQSLKDTETLFNSRMDYYFNS